MTDFNQKTHDTDVGSHGGQSRQMMEVFENQEFGSIRVLLDAAQPKADYFDTFVNSEDCTCIRNFCQEIGIPEKTAVALLLDPAICTAVQATG
nr:phage antirepressor KilAC domain-containing protein [Butyricicoccus sp. OF27-2pH9A]